MIAVIGPGHGGPGLVAHTYLEGSYTALGMTVVITDDTDVPVVATR